MAKNKWLYVGLTTIWVVLSVIFGINDLEISKNLVDYNSRWAKFLEDYGMIPGLFVILSGIFVYYSNIKARSDVWSYVQKVVFFLVSTGLTFYLFEILLDKIPSDRLIFFMVISFAINLIIFLVVQKRNAVSSSILIKYSNVVIGMALWGYVFGIQIVKYFWGRVRFRQLDATFSQFTPWYLPQGITGFDSFPSGHAAMGFILLPLLILLMNKKRWIKISVFSLIVVWAVVLAFSRIVIGAHFASDVLFGAFFIITTFIILNRSNLIKIPDSSS